MILSPADIEAIADAVYRKFNGEYETPREAVSARALEYAQYRHDLNNAPDETAKTRIRKAFQRKRKNESGL